MGSKSDNVILLTLLFIFNIIILSQIAFPHHHSHHHSQAHSIELGREVEDTFASLAVDLKSAFASDKLPELASLPSRLASGVITRLVTSVLPQNVFTTADVLLQYDFATWSHMGSNFTYRMAQAFWEGDYFHETCTGIDVGNRFSVVSSFMDIVANVKPLSSSLDVPVQSSWLGGFLVYLPNDLYNVMKNTAQWFKTFSDCENLMENYAHQNWEGIYIDPTGNRHHWNCYGCSDIMTKVSHVCQTMALASNMTGPRPLLDNDF